MDYHFGELLPVIKLLQDEELIFVMYYAPWCAESVRVRGEFIRAAKTIGEAVSMVVDVLYDIENTCTCLECHLVRYKPACPIVTRMNTLTPLQHGSLKHNC